MVYVIIFWRELAGQMGAAQWRAKGSDAGPHLKELYKENSPIFKDTDILHTGSEIKNDIIMHVSPISHKATNHQCFI